MQERIRHVAARIRELREIAGVSVERLADELGIPAGTCREYEAGAADIPVSFLYRVASRFGVELSAILTGGDPRLHVCSVVRRGKGPGVERRTGYRYESLAPNFAHKKAEPFLVTVPPSPPQDPAPVNSHPGQEFNYLLEGELLVTIDSRDIVLQEGDALFFDAAHPHGMKARGDRPARFLAVVL